MKMKSLCFLILVFVLAGFPAAYGASVDLSNVTIKVSENNGEWSPMYKASGLFDNTPYKITYSTFNNALDNLTAMASGRVDISDIAILGLVALQNASATPWTADSAPLKVVSLRHSDFKGALPRYVFMASSKSGISEFTRESIRGKKIAHSRGGSNELVFYAGLRKLGLTLNDVQRVYLNTTESSLALMNNQVDLVTGNLETYGAAIATGAKVVATSQDFGIPILAGVVANTKALNDPVKGVALADFIKRWVVWENWFNTDSKGAIGAYVKGRNFKQEQAELAWKYSRQVVAPVSKDMIAKQQSANDLCLDFGMIEKKIGAAVTFDDRFSKLVAQTMVDLKFEDNLKASLAASGR
jgi:sulfonate transport system substrate-binding protein